MIKFLRSKWTSLLVGLFVLVFGANTAMAASLSQVTAVPDSNNAGATTNYTVRLQTANPINPGGLIRVDYPAGFNLSNVELGPTGTRSANLGTAGLHRFSDHVFVELGADSNVGAPEIVYFQLRGVINTSTVGNYQATIQTLNPSMGLIDGPNLSQVFSIVQTQTLHHFAVGPSTVSTTVGQNVTLTIIAQDVNNSTVTNYSGTPTFSGLATSPNSTAPYYGSVVFSNGVASVIVCSYSAQTGQSVNVTDSGKTGNSGAITFSPSSLTSIRIEPSQSIQTITAGTNIQFSAAGSDVYGNLRSGDVFTWTGTTSTGLFNNRTVGNYTVYASAAGYNSNQVAIGVTHAPASSVVISPAGPLTMTADQSQTFSVNATDVYGNSWNATSTATYNENDPVGSFTSNTYNAGRVGSWTIYTTVDGINSGNVTANVTHGTSVGIIVTPDPRTVSTGGTVTYASTATDADANTWDVTSTTNFSITAGAGGSWSNNIYTSANTGTWVVTGTYGSLNDTASLTVTTQTLVLTSIVITPLANQTITAGTTIQFTAQGFDQFGQAMSGITFTWTGTNSNGLFNNTLAGTYTIRASSGSINSNWVTVVVNPGSLARIQIEPSVSTQSIIAGQTIQFTATGYDAYNNSLNGLSFIWHNTNTSGLFNNTITGVYEVYASIGFINSNRINVRVNPASTATIWVLPSWNETIGAGSNTKIWAIVFDAYGNPVADGTIVNWSHGNSNFTLSDMTSTTVDGIAIITLIAPNQTNQSTTITATAHRITSTSGIITTGPASVLTFINIFPYYDQTITAGTGMQFFVTGYDQYGNMMSGINFSWHDATNSGLFNNTTAGSYSVYASFGGKTSNKITVKVIPAKVDSISISPFQISNLNPGITITVTATLKDAYGNLVADGTEVSWSSSDSAFTLSSGTSKTINGIATVSITAPKTGGLTTYITASSGGKSVTTGYVYINNNTEEKPVTKPKNFVGTAKAAETADKTKIENNNNQTGQAVEMATKTTPLIEASSTEKPQRNWWIPIIIAIIIAGAAYYGYTAMAGKDEKPENIIKPDKTEKKITDEKKINTSKTKEIKPINDDKNEKPRW